MTSPQQLRRRFGWRTTTCLAALLHKCMFVSMVLHNGAPSGVRRAREHDFLPAAEFSSSRDPGASLRKVGVSWQVDRSSEHPQSRQTLRQSLELFCQFAVHHSLFVTFAHNIIREAAGASHLAAAAHRTAGCIRG